MTRLLGVLVLALAISGVGCRRVELDKVLTVTDVFTGWYYLGMIDGLNKVVPSFSFRLTNGGDAPVSRVQLLVSFWPQGADGELDSKQVTGIGADALAPGASTDPILVRSETGYTLEQPKDELFMHSEFKDFSVKLFARRDGQLVPLGEFPIERRIIPSTTQP